MNKPRNSELTLLQQKIKELESKQKKQKKIHAELLESENRFRMIFENANDGIILHDTKGNIIDVNHTMYQRLGYTKTEMLKMSLNDLVAPEFADKIKGRMNILKTEGVAIFESADTRKDGTIMPVEVSARYVTYKGKTIIQSVVRDIHKRKLAEDLIAQAIKDKTMLKEEIQRQNNINYGIFSNMLVQLEKSTPSSHFSATLKKYQDRLKAITYIHDKVYKYSSLTRIDFASMTKSLTTYLYNLYWNGVDRISIQRDIKGIYFNVRTTLLCSLLINELMSNSLVHAFSKNKSGKIIIGIKSLNKGKYALTVHDTGIGLPKNSDYKKPQTLGLRICQDLVNQLNGELAVKRKKGTEITINFKL